MGDANRPHTDARLQAAQVLLGEGLVDIGPFEFDGRRGVILRVRANAIPFGEPGELQDVTYWPTAEDVVLWIERPDSADVLLGAILEVTEALKPGTKVGEPLPHYTRGEEDWPLAWKLPEARDDADLFEQMATLSDDLLLREAVHCWDNCLRVPEAFAGIQGGLISAHARLIVGFGALLGKAPQEADLESAADGVREAWLAMARQAISLQSGAYLETEGNA